MSRLGRLLRRTALTGEFPDPEARRQLLWLVGLRFVVLGTALATTALLDLVIQADWVVTLNVTPLYVVFGIGFLLALVGLLAQAVLRSTATIAVVQFGGDIVVETALLHVLGYQGAVAFAMALFFLTTFLACTYLGRAQGTAFAFGAFLLQVGAHVLAHAGWLPEQTLRGSGSIRDIGIQGIVFNLFSFMFTFHATAWLVGSRAERLRAVRARLQTVVGDLADLRALHERVVTSMSAGLVTTTDDGRITYLNPAAESLLGQDSGGLRGKLLSACLGWSGPLGADVEPLRAGAPAIRFSRVSAVGPEPRRARELDVVAWRLVDRGQRPLGLLFLLEDVTEFKALEAEVRLKEKMAAIGEMAAGIAHEIRNPLASISGSVQMLQRGLDLDGDQARLMRIVLSESSRLDKTIREFLEFARPRGPVRRRIDINVLARETLALLAHGSGVGSRHVIEPPPPSPVFATADSDQVRQVLWNLCNNALKAMPDGGRLVVATHLAGEEVVISVEDSGVGMSPAMRQRAFQPLAGEFSSGIGLGLAIVYRIVRDHGGRVLVDSEPGRGTRIEVRLPTAVSLPQVAGATVTS